MARKGLVDQLLEGRHARVRSFLARAKLHADRDDTLPRARRVLAEERAKFLDALEDIPSAYVVTNLRGVILDANSQASSLLGEPRLVDKLLVGYVARRDVDCFREALQDLAKQERRESVMNVRMRERGGPPFSALLSVRLVYGLGRQPVALRWLIYGDAPTNADARGIPAVFPPPMQESPP